jgi:hypothetical protein
LAVEDLWELPLTGRGVSLDGLAKAVNREVKDSEEESFVSTRSKSNTTLTLKLDILKHIIKVKLEEKELAKTAQERAIKRAKLLRILADKQDQSLQNQSEADIEKMLAELS